jgi:protein-tyrosine phosphatase
MKISDKMREEFSRIVLVNNEDKITDNLWVGGNPVDVMKYNYIVAVNKTPTYHIPNGAMAIVYPFDDAAWMPDLNKLHELAETVNRFSSMGPTLVHCSAGLNRSALVVALALIKRGMTPGDAIALIRSKRGSDALHNKTFTEWLMALSTETKDSNV